MAARSGRSPSRVLAALLAAWLGLAVLAGVRAEGPPAPGATAVVAGQQDVGRPAAHRSVLAAALPQPSAPLLLLPVALLPAVLLPALRRVGAVPAWGAGLAGRRYAVLRPGRGPPASAGSAAHALP